MLDDSKEVRMRLGMGKSTLRQTTECSECDSTEFKAAALARRDVVGAVPMIQTGYNLRRPQANAYEY